MKFASFLTRRGFFFARRSFRSVFFFSFFFFPRNHTSASYTHSVCVQRVRLETRQTALVVVGRSTVVNSRTNVSFSLFLLETAHLYYIFSSNIGSRGRHRCVRSSLDPARARAFHCAVRVVVIIIYLKLTPRRQRTYGVYINDISYA